MAVNINIVDPIAIERKRSNQRQRLAFRAGGYTVATRPFMDGLSLFVLDKDQKLVYEKLGTCERWLIQDGFDWLLSNKKIRKNAKIEKGVVQYG